MALCGFSSEHIATFSKKHSTYVNINTIFSAWLYFIEKYSKLAFHFNWIPAIIFQCCSPTVIWEGKAYLFSLRKFVESPALVSTEQKQLRIRRDFFLKPLQKHIKMDLGRISMFQTFNSSQYKKFSIFKAELQAIYRRNAYEEVILPGKWFVF